MAMQKSVGLTGLMISLAVHDKSQSMEDLVMAVATVRLMQCNIARNSIAAFYQRVLNGDAAKELCAAMEVTSRELN